MSGHFSIRPTMMLVFIVTIGLSFAFSLPWLANLHSLAAQDVTASDAACRYYVATSGDGSNPELGFSTAYTNVQNALAEAGAGPCDIWVVKGVYYPDEGVGQTPNERTATFALTDSVSLFGGFKVGDTALSDRDWENNVTVLSGDIDENDTVDGSGVVTNALGIKGLNSFHVLTSSGVNGSAVLDGFTVTAGYANICSQNLRYGAGMINLDGGSPTLKNVVFSGNWACEHGGGMYNDNGDPSFTNVTFTGNRANTNGGGLHNISSQPSLTQTTFYSNTAVYGGGMSNVDSSPIIVQSVFSKNVGKDYGGGIHNTSSSNPILIDVSFFYNEGIQGGAGMANSGSSPKLNNVVFQSNTSPLYGLGGAGIFNQSNSNPAITNAIFSGNYTGYKGAGISNRESHPLLTNVTFSGNRSAGPGGAISNQNGSHPEARNTIFWNNMTEGVTGTINASIKNETGSAISITHSLLEASGGSSSWALDTSFVDLLGNIDQDPKFIASISPAAAPTAAGNLRLQGGSPAIDTGKNDYISGVPSDLDGEARVKDGDGDGAAFVDMGAYESAALYQLIVTKAGAGNGVVTSTPAGIDCGETCSLLLKEASAVTLAAIANRDSIFTGWNGACSGVGDCQLVMDADKSVTALFEPGVAHYLPLVKR